jgi:hypothetical protein
MSNPSPTCHATNAVGAIGSGDFVITPPSANRMAAASANVTLNSLSGPSDPLRAQQYQHA